MKKLLLASVICIFACVLHAQITTKEQPLGLSENVQTIGLSVANLEKMKKIEDFLFKTLTVSACRVNPRTEAGNLEQKCSLRNFIKNNAI